MRYSLVVVGALCAAGAVRAGDKVTPAPTYSKEVVAILHDQCVICHRPGEAAPFSLLTYEDARKRAKLIAHVTQSKQMPPWKVGATDVAFRNERHLTGDQIAVFQR